MAKQLVNELTWSVSRDALFQTCRRAYYYNYYGSWGGWERQAPERTRLAYILKNLLTLPIWAGGIVHQIIAETLRRHAHKPTPISAGELQARATQKLRAGWVEAVNREWLEAPKKTNLFELYYGNGKNLPAEQTEACKRRVLQCLEAFAHSAILSEILAASYLAWRPIDQLDAFLVDGGLKVWCAIDFAFTDPTGKLRIVDWKTGAEKSEALQTQLACYALYAVDKWHTPLDSIAVAGVFLGDNARVSHYPVNPEIVVAAKDYMLNSAAAMREPLVDVVANQAREEDFPLCDDDRPCRRCNFQQICPRFASPAG